MIKKFRNLFIGDRAFYAMVFSVALPIMVQNGITNFVGLLDNVMVGRVGTEQMTGVAIVNQIIFVFNLAIFGAVAGAGIFGAQFHGSGNHEGVRYTFRFKLIISVVVTAVAVFILLVFGEDLIRTFLMGEGDVENIEASLAYGMGYLRIMLPGLLPFALVQCYSGTLRETGETVLPMKAGIVAVLVNLVFNAILIFGLLGAPALGSDGAAIATVLSRFVECGIVVVWTHRHSAKHPFIKGALRSLRIPMGLTGRIALKAAPLVLNETLWALGNSLLAQSYSMRGYEVVSAHNIASTVNNLFIIAFLAMGNAIGIIVGQQLGAGEPERAVDSARKLTFFSVAICVALGALLALAAPFFPLIYNATSDIRSLATGLILIMAAVMPIHALAHAYYFTLRSGGRILITMIFDSFYVCGITFPLAFLLSRFTSMPIIPLFLCCQLVEIGKCILGAIMVKRRIWVRNIVS